MNPETTADVGHDTVPVFDFSDVGKTFFRRGTLVEALRALTFQVYPGEFVALVGPSGCGKSTALNMAAGLIGYNSGGVTFKGQQLRGVNTGIGYMTQNDSLLPWRTVAKNIALPLEVTKTDRRSRNEAVKRTLEMVGLSGFGHSYPSELSGGMRKRVALARTLVSAPDTLLMDEPFGALDAQLRTVMHGELLRICAATQKTVLFVTHDLQEALTLADRVLLFSPRPGMIKEVLRVDLPSPRDATTVQFSEEFAQLYSVLWELLKEEMAQGEEM